MKSSGEKFSFISTGSFVSNFLVTGTSGIRKSFVWIWMNDSADRAMVKLTRDKSTMEGIFA